MCCLTPAYFFTHHPLDERTPRTILIRTLIAIGLGARVVFPLFRQRPMYKALVKKYVDISQYVPALALAEHVCPAARSSCSWE